MEDSHIADINIHPGKNSSVFGVFDGHGGKEVAIFVKKHFTEELLKNNTFLKGDMKNALIENFLRMDDIMVTKSGKEELKSEARKSKSEDEAQSQNQGGQKNSQMDFFRQMVDPKQDPNCDVAMFTGCTASVCGIFDGKMYFANAGDSRSVLCKKGQAIPMSIDHKPELEIERNRIEKAGGWVTEGRVKGKLTLTIGNLNLSRSLGDLEYKQNKKLSAEDQMITAYPDVVVENFTDDLDFLIIGCDGVWDCKTNQEACDFVSERLKKNPNIKLTKIIEELFDEILATDIYTGKF